MLLERVYGELRDMALADSQYEFSRLWLGQSRSYMSSAKARQRKPSIQVLMRLSQRLKTFSSKFAEVATTNAERAICRRLNTMMEMVGNEVREQAVQ